MRISSISWRHNGEAITIDGSKYSEQSGSLRVNDIVVEDEGTYGCNVNGGEWQDMAYLYVLGKALY